MKTKIQKSAGVTYILLLALLTLFPQLSFAQSTDSIQDFLWAIGYFINARLIPFFFAIALLIFLYNTARYFVIGGDNEESRGKAKQMATYAIIGFVFLVSIWGIVNLLVSGLGFSNETPVTPDYIEKNYAPGSAPNRTDWSDIHQDIF